MMGYIKCFDLANELIEEANNQTSGLVINKKRFEKFKEFCNNIDILYNMDDPVEGWCFSESLTVEVKENSYDIVITISSGEIVVYCQNLIRFESNAPTLFKLMKSAQTSFSISDDGLMNISFTYPTIWDGLNKEVLSVDEQ